MAGLRFIMFFPVVVASWPYLDSNVIDSRDTDPQVQSFQKDPKGVFFEVFFKGFPPKEPFNLGLEKHPTLAAYCNPWSSKVGVVHPLMCSRFVILS